MSVMIDIICSGYKIIYQLIEECSMDNFNFFDKPLKINL